LAAAAAVMQVVIAVVSSADPSPMAPYALTL
jgi:hypothetical protein